MPRIAPVHWKVLECVFLADGFRFDRQTGSHRVYEKAGVLRLVIIPVHGVVDTLIIKSNMRTAGMSRERYFQLLRECTRRG